MCGLTGFLSHHTNQTAGEMLATVGRMAEALHHRLWISRQQVISR